MVRQILLNSLESRVTRNSILANSPRNNYRVLSNNASGNNNSTNIISEFFTDFLGKGLKFSGWLLGKTLQLGAFSFVGLINLVKYAATSIWNFNWNISETEIDRLWEQSKLLLASYSGGITGQALGYLACGILPGTAILAFNEPLGLYLLKEVGEEALDELSASLAVLIQQSFRIFIQGYYLNQFKNVRRAIKKYVADRRGDKKSLINNFYGGKFAQAIEAWGEPDSKPWSFNLFFERGIEEIDNPYSQEFTEEAYDEFKDSCSEAGYVLAQGLDSWILQQRIAENQQSDDSNLIEVLPDRDAPEERLIFNGNDRQVRTQIINSLNTFQLVDNRDVGQIIGEPLLDSVRKPPVSLSLRIYLRGTPKPPWKNADGSLAKRAQVTIPNVKKSKLDWQTIKQAVGGINGYSWGRFFVEANLDDGNKITFYAGSEQEGQNIANSLLTLTNAELTTLNITEEKKEGSRLKYKALYKEFVRVYPANLTIINQNQILRVNEGIATSRGMYKRRRYLVPLHTDTKPDNFDLIIQELSRRDDIS